MEQSERELWENCLFKAEYLLKMGYLMDPRDRFDVAEEIMEVTKRLKKEEDDNRHIG